MAAPLTFAVYNIKPTKLPGALHFSEKGIDLSLKSNKSVTCQNTVKLQWLEHLWDYENMFETGVLRANECKS